MRCRRARRGSAAERARRRRAGGGRLSRHRRNRQGHHGPRSGARRAGRARVSRGTAQRRTDSLVTAGGRVLTVVGRGATYREAIDTAYRAASQDQLRRHAVPARHRPQGLNGATTPDVECEVLHRHVRLPRQSGRLAGDRRGACARAATCRRAARGRRSRRRQHVFGDGDARIRARGRPSDGSPAPIPTFAWWSPVAMRRDGRTKSRELPNVVRVVANGRKGHRWSALDAEGELRPRSGERVRRRRWPCGMTLEPGVAGRTALTLRVQTGCDEQCSYCIIPHDARRRAFAAARATFFATMRRAVGAGYSEIAITGVHLGSYGRDLGDGTSLTALVRELWRVAETMCCFESVRSSRWTARRRSSTSLRESPRLAPHFHLPLQHGSDDDACGDAPAVHRRVLPRSRRARFTRGYPRRRSGPTSSSVSRARATTDFAETRALLECAAAHAYCTCFPYSDRPGTAAAALMRERSTAASSATRARAVREIGATACRRASGNRRSDARMRALTVDDGRRS